MKLFLTVLITSFSFLLTAQIKSGPMLGHVGKHEALIWVQTEKEMSLELKISETEGANSQTMHETTMVTFRKDRCTKTIRIPNLKPDRKYFYSFYDENKLLSTGNFKTQPLLLTNEYPEIDFTFGSCTYLNDVEYDRAGKPFGRAFDIFTTIAKQQPNFMLWLGDNIYLRSGEWDSKTGIYNRYTKFKSKPELQQFWKQCSHYAIWDDHDYGPNDADRGFKNKELSLAAFKDFWANDSYNDLNQGINSQFSYADLDFFLLDNRYHRTPNKRKTGERHILGDAQVQWLIDGLVSSKASFKFVVVGGQFLSDAPVYENHATYAEERKIILELLEKEGLKNVIFLTGDRHKSELTKLTLKNDITFYDFTSSPLASKAFDSENEGNSLQVKGTHVATQNFGKVTVNGTRGNRKVTLSCYNAQGKQLWAKEITQE